MKAKNRCAYVVNKIVEWNAEKGDGSYNLELGKVVNGKNHISLIIRSKNTNKKVVRITVKTTGAVMFDVSTSVRKEIINVSFKHRILSTKKWQRIECGYKEIEMLLKELDEKY